MIRLRRSIPTAANFIQSELGPKRYRPAMLTLTYRDVDGFSPRHVSLLLDHIRKWLSRRGHGFSYVWVAELQQRGALHYHIIVWLPRGLTLPKPDKQGWWPHGSTNIQWARNAVGYLVKYVSKMDSKHPFPRGCRLSGRGGLSADSRAICRWTNYASWKKRLFGVNTPIQRIKGIGLVNQSTGEVFPSPWRVFAGKSSISALQLFEYEEGVDYCGPYSTLEM